MNASGYIWRCAGSPEQKHPTSDGDGLCIICGDDVTGRPAVERGRIIKTTTAGDSTLLKYRNASHFCIPCAWLMEAGKGRPGNFIAAGGAYEQAVISLESVVEEKRPWIEIVRELSGLPADEPATGVLTTDVKVRLWHRCQMATIGRFGLYVHAPDYDVSEWRRIDLTRLVEYIDALRQILLTGYSKRSIYHGLHTDYKRFTADPAAAIETEAMLSRMRMADEFLPALIMAGVTKEEKRAHASAARHTHAAPAARGADHPHQPGLF